MNPARLLSFAAALCALAPGTLARAASLQDNLRAYGAQITRTVSSGREIQLYHWAYLQSVLAGKDTTTPVSPNDGRVRSYLGYLRDQTFRTGVGYGVAGPGIYAAIDPVVTCSYGGCLRPGGTPGVLVQFVLTPGVRFLDLNYSNYFPSELASQVAQAGCSASSAYYLFAGAQDPRCRAIRDQLIAVTGTSALRYPYSAMQFPSCSNRGNYAFVLFGDEAINWNRLVAFTSTLPQGDDGHQENRLILEALFSQVSGYDGSPWPALQGQKPRWTNLDAWMKTNLMGCGNWPEDQP